MNNICSYRPSYHAEQRMAERNFIWNELMFVIQNGRQTTSYKGRRKFTLRERDIPVRVNYNQRFAHLVGLAVIVSGRKPVVITAYHQNHKLC